MRRIFILCAIVLALSASPDAGDFPPMPENALCVVSVRSVNEFMDSSGDYIAAASPKKIRPIPKGMIRMAAQLTLPPLVWEVFDCDAPAFFVAPTDAEADAVHAVVAQTVGFDKLLAGLGENEIAFTPLGETGSIRIAVPDLGDYYAAELHDGLAVFAKTPKFLETMLKAFQEGWRPTHWGEGVAVADFQIPAGWRLRDPEMVAIEQDMKRDAEQPEPTEPPATFGEAWERGVRALALRFVPAAFAEMDGIRRVAVELSLDAKSASIAVLLRSAPETLVARSAASAERGHAARFPDDISPAGIVVQTSTHAAIEEILPGFGNALPEYAELLLRHAYPDDIDAWRDALAAISAHAAGPAVAAFHAKGIGPHFALWVRSDDPAAAVDALKKAFGAAETVANDVARHGEGKAPVIRFEISEGETFGGAAAVCVRLGEETAAALASGVNGDDSVGTLFVLEEMLPLLAARFAAVDGYLVAVAGLAREEELAAAVRAVRAEDKAPWRTAAGEQILAGLGESQHTIGLVNSNQMLLNYWETLVSTMIAARADAEGGEGWEALTEEYEKVRPKLLQSEALSGFGVGGRNGALVYRILVPAKAASVVIHNALVMRDFTGKMIPKLLADSISRRHAFIAAALKQYHKAQESHAQNAGDGFAKDLGTLAGKEESADSAAVIPAEIAAAGAGDGCVPYRGYVFAVDPAVEDWKEDFALYAYPEKHWTSGVKVLWIGKEGVVKERTPILPRGAKPRMYGPEDSPLNAPELWKDF